MSIPLVSGFVSSVSHLPVNIFDIFFVVFLLLYVFEEATLGLVRSLLDFITVIISFLVGVTGYGILSAPLSQYFSLAKGISDALSFLILAGVMWVVLRIVLMFIRRLIPKLPLPNIVDVFGGAVFAVLSYIFLASFIFSVLESFPLSQFIKSNLAGSRAAAFLVLKTGIFESNIHQIFGGAGEDMLNFLTIEPKSDASIPLHFTVDNPKVDVQDEEKMLTDVNRQRALQNLPPLEKDNALTAIARAHAKDMLMRGYFSHYTPEGYSPFDRMEAAGISYTSAGENLAFAPTESIAMQGLMKSPGHRANILSPSFHKVGIGVLDAGIYGEMFVQDFTD